MDPEEKQRVNRRLRSGVGIDRQAVTFCELMTSAPVNLHESESFFNIKKHSDFSFLITAHHREIRAEYSHVFVGDGGGNVRGRFQFKLAPVASLEPLAIVDSPILLTFVFEENGIFIIDGTEYMCDPVGFQRAQVRNVLVSYAIASLQRELTMPIPG